MAASMRMPGVTRTSARRVSAIHPTTTPMLVLAMNPSAATLVHGGGTVPAGLVSGTRPLRPEIAYLTYRGRLEMRLTFSDGRLARSPCRYLPGGVQAAQGAPQRQNGQ